MSTRDELEDAIDEALGDRQNWESYGGCLSLADEASRNVADALIAEGWRKKPSRDEVARAIAWGVDGVDGEQFDEAAVDYRLEMLQGADAVLALMDRGQ